MLHCIRASGDTSVVNGYLIHSLFFQTSETTTSFWQIQANIISQLQLIRSLLIIITIIHPDHDGQSVKTFPTKLKCSGWILSSTDVQFLALGDTIAGSCRIITAVHSSCALSIEQMLLEHTPMVPPRPLGEFIWEPFKWNGYAILLACNDANFSKQKMQLKVSTHSTTSSNTNDVPVQYNLHQPKTNELVIVGSKVVSLDGLCPAFNACPNPNIFQHHFGIEFHHEGHSYIQAISPYEFIHCFGFINQMTYRLFHPTCKFAMDAAMPAHSSAWLLKQAHSYLVYLQHANSKAFLPNQFAALTTMIQAFVNSAIGVQLPSKEWWVQAYSDDTEMSTIHDLITNPSKINNLTLNMVNYNYLAPLQNSQIMLKDGLLIYRKPICGGSSFTCLQLVPSAFYNIIFITFH
jgi:hypothetical protein